ncbi:MAG: sugar porter family MFS transporter [Weeksellaceae bacterium]
MKKNLLLFITIVASLGGLLFGYDTGIINGTQYYFSQYFELSAAMKGWVVGSALLGCLVGAVASGKISTMIGRRNSLILSAILFFVSSLGSGLPSFLPQSVELLVIFRILGGLGIGLASMNAPTYISEISPAAIRGKMVSYYQLAVVTGFFIVFLVTYFIGESYTIQQNLEYGWRVMFWTELIPATLFIIGLFMVPKSPRWLLLKGRTEDGKKVLLELHGKEYADKEYAEIHKDIVRSENSKNKKVNIFQKGVFAVIVIGTVFSVLQQFTGINAVLYYGADIFEKALGINKEDVLQQQILLAAVNFTFTFVAMYTIDKIGRKPLVYIGCVGMALGFLLLGFSLKTGDIGILSLIGVLMFIGSFAMSMGPVVWVMLSEMFPNKIRSVAMAIAVAAQWLANYIVSQSFPIIMDSEVNMSETWNGSLPYFIFTGFIIFTIFFTWKYLPETKGKSLEDLNETWGIVED